MVSFFIFKLTFIYLLVIDFDRDDIYQLFLMGVINT